MFIRPCYRKKDGKRHAYWALVESVRTENGPRQRVVAYLGQLEKRQRSSVKTAAEDRPASPQGKLFADEQAEWAEVDLKGVRVEKCRDFGGPWLGLELIRQLGLKEFMEQAVDCGREDIPWSLMSWVLVLARLCEPSSELHIAEHFYEGSALPELLGVPADKVNDDRLYRALDALLPCKEKLETHLKNRLGELFKLEYDLLLYDVTSVYFEGQAQDNALAQRGYSRDHRPDCKQVCIALVVSREGIPLGYEIFAGNRSDVTTLEEIVTMMESRYGKAQKIWVLDRGMISEGNMEFLKEGGRRYIVGTPRGMLKRFERELLSENWEKITNELDVKRCASEDGDEVFILCRSSQRREKEKAIHQRFERKIEEGLKGIERSCERRKLDVVTIARRVGRLLGGCSRAAGLFDARVTQLADGTAKLEWRKIEKWREWAELTEGCYILRSNVTDWSAQDLWQAYIQLTEAETAFRIHKSRLEIRPVWHQKEERVRAHILVCFLAYVLLKTLGQLCKRAGLGNEPQRVFEEIAKIRLVDVVLPTRAGVEIRRRCVTRPTEHQAILLERLGLKLSLHLKTTEM
jgi:transposase